MIPAMRQIRAITMPHFIRFETMTLLTFGQADPFDATYIHTTSLKLKVAHMDRELDELNDLHTVCNYAKHSKAGLYKLIKLKRFPKPIKLGRRSLWSRQSLQAWQQRESELPPSVSPRK
jgi:predicted DNA-binding transcriptional regulator AlpA